MKRALFFLCLLACKHHDASLEKDDDKKKEGAHAVVTEDKRTAAEEAIHAYETAGSCDARAQAMVNGKSHRDLLGAQCAARKVERYETAECDNLSGALTQCHAVARRDGDKIRYWLVKQPNAQFLVDFLATERPVQLADLIDHLPSTPSVARVRAYKSSSYNGQFRTQKASYFALRIKAPKEDRSAFGYAYARRDSPEGVALASITKSIGDEVDLTLAISFPTRDSQAAVIHKVFGTDFFETDAERDFGKQDGGP